MILTFSRLSTCLLAFTLVALFTKTSFGQAGEFETIVIQNGVANDGVSLFEQFVDCQLNEQSQILIQASLSNTPNGMADDRGLFLWSDGIIENLVRESDASPDGNGTWSTFSGLLNPNGQVVIEATLQNSAGGSTDDTGIFFFDGTSLGNVVREGDLDYDNSVTVNQFLESRINANGDLAFLWTNSLNEKSIFSESGGGAGRYIVTANGTQAAPDLNGFFSDVSATRINQPGDIAFIGGLTSTNNGNADDEGIFPGQIRNDVPNSPGRRRCRREHPEFFF